MKSIVFALLAACATTTLAAKTQWHAPAPAGRTTAESGDVIQFERGPGGDPGRGGELIAHITRLETSGDLRLARVPGAPRWDAFSVERDEPLDFGVHYTVTKVSRSASFGGRGGRLSEGGDPIDPRTAYLYEQFYFQRLSDFAFDDYTPPIAPATAPSGLRNAHAEQLQRAIWFLENELEGVDPATGDSLRYRYDPTNLEIAKKTLGKDSPAYRWIVEADAAARDPNNHIGNLVRVLTLVDDCGGCIQDVLAVVAAIENRPISVAATEPSTSPAQASTGLLSASGVSAAGSGGGFGGNAGGGSGGSFGIPPSPHGTPTVTPTITPTPDPHPTPGPIPVPTPEPGSLLIWTVIVSTGGFWAWKRRQAHPENQPSVDAPSA